VDSPISCLPKAISNTQQQHIPPIPIMASRRAARLWAAITTVAVLCSVVAAQGTGPSMPVAYCSNINTADMDACKLQHGNAQIMPQECPLTLHFRC
jgi:hypothetical protein